MKKIIRVILSIILMTTVISGTLRNEIQNIHAQALIHDEVTDFANVVVFAYFKGDTEQRDLLQSELFHDEMIEMFDSAAARSFKGYMSAISYGNFQIENYFIQDNGETFTAIELSITQEQAAGFPQDGIITEDILRALNQEFKPADLPNYDLTGDNNIDNFTVIIGGDEGSDPSEYPSLWPHQGVYGGTSTLGNQRLLVTNFLSTNRIQSIFGGAGLIAHEFLHSIGYEDLYTDSFSYKPVGEFDIMADTSIYMQYPLAYLRAYYSSWLTIQEYSESQAGLQLNHQSNREGNQAIILKSPLNEDEFFVVEYREEGNQYADDETYLDAKIGGEGLIVYRIDATQDSLGNLDGYTSVYVFRKGGNPASLDNALLGVGDSFGVDIGETGETLTFSDGSNSGIVIDNITISMDGMKFDATIPNKDEYDVWDNTGFSSKSPTISSVVINEKVFTLTQEEDISVLSSYSEGIWVNEATFEFLGTAYEPELFTHEDELYYSYITHTNDDSRVNIVKLVQPNSEGGNWNSEVYDVIDPGVFVNEYQAFSIDQAIQVAFESPLGNNNVVKLATLNGSPTNHSDFSSAVTVGDLDSKFIGTIESAIWGSTLYLSYVADGVVHVYERQVGNTGSFNKISDDTIEANSYDMIGYQNQVFIVNANINFSDMSVETSMNIYKEGIWSSSRLNLTTASKSVELNTPTLSIADSNLYVLGEDSGDVYAFYYDETQETPNWIQEGTTVGTNGENDFNLLSAGNRLLVSYVTSDLSVAVKEKIVANELLSINITLPTKLIYEQFEPFDALGLTVKANYSTGTRFLKEGEYGILGFSTEKTGNFTASVTVGDNVKTFDYSVVKPKPVLYDIAVTGVPLMVKQGETIDLSALIVTALYNDNSSVNVSSSDYSIGSIDTTSTGKKKLTISYSGIVKEIEIEVIENDGPLLGDVNQDKLVNEKDIQRLLLHINKEQPLTDLSLGDINQDGVVNSNDLQRLYVILNK